MSEEGDNFWVSLSEKATGFILVVLGAILLYFTATTSLGGFTALFGVISVVLIIIGLFLLLVRAPE